MKGTLIGTDYLQKGDNVKILELNTNAAIYNSGVEHLDLLPFFTMLTANTITELHFIFNEQQAAAPAGQSENKFVNLLTSLCSTNSIELTLHPVESNAITIPEIEDTPNRFILRQAYDTSAIIDSTYAADKFEFIKLMEGSNFIPKSYFTGYDANFDMVDLESNIGRPNLIEKARHPYYNSEIFPRVSTLVNETELNDKKLDVLQNREEHLLQEFIYDEANIQPNGYWTTIRSFDIIFGSTLDVVNLGGYTVSAPVPMSFSEDVYTLNTKDLNNKSRIKYITKNSVKRTELEAYHTDGESNILQSDGSVLNVSQIETGSFIKSLTFDLTYGQDSSGSLLNEDFINHEGTLELTNQTLQIVSSSLVEIKSQTKDLIMIEIGLDSGEVWNDTPTCVYYIEDVDTGKTFFCPVNKLKLGDKILSYNSLSGVVGGKAVVNLSIVYKENLEVFNLDYEPYNFFLVNIEKGTDYAIMHNYCNYCGSGYSWAQCGSYWCDSYCSFCDDPVLGPGGGGQK